MTGVVGASAYDVKPANEANWVDLAAVFGVRGPASRCWCQRYKLAPNEAFASFPSEDRAARLRDQTAADCPRSATTSGLVAYLEDEPVGWCAVEAAVAHARNSGARVLEAYPMTTGSAVSEELHPGLLSTYLSSGFVETHRPSARRAVVSITF